jgi:hypothetical protein
LFNQVVAGKSPDGILFGICVDAPGRAYHLHAGDGLRIPEAIPETDPGYGKTLGQGAEEKESGVTFGDKALARVGKLDECFVQEKTRLERLALPE